MCVDVGPEPRLVEPAVVVDQEAVAGALGRHDDGAHPATIAERRPRQFGQSSWPNAMAIGTDRVLSMYESVGDHCGNDDSTRETSSREEVDP